MRRVKSAPSSPMAEMRSTLVPEHFFPVPEPPAVLELSGILDATPKVDARPKLGSPEMPTAGSAQHYLGECKPCAFFWKQAGCSNGVNCTFCHLCDSNERKRRQKEKKAFLKTQTF